MCRESGLGCESVHKDRVVTELKGPHSREGGSGGSVRLNCLANGSIRVR